MKTVVILILCVCLAPLAGAESTGKCAVCQSALTGAFYWISSPALRERQPACKSCSQLTTLCFVCGLPVKTPARKFDDGRLLCGRDARGAVLAPDEAERIFDDARRELLTLFAGTGALPDRNLTVALVDGAELERLHKAQRSFHDRTLTMGLTRTRRSGATDFEHHIHLLNGLGPARLAAVAAHEWAHCWLHENVPATRPLDGDTVEGFCELVAYKLMTQRNEELEKKVILANAYTRGQVNTMVKAENDHQFLAIVEWMKSGNEPKFDPGSGDRVMPVNNRPPTPLVWLPQTVTPVPPTLTLKGIGGTPQRRFALINNRTLTKDEMAKVRVGHTNVVVRCLDITENTVTLQINGAETTTLVLPPN